MLNDLFTNEELESLAAQVTVNEVRCILRDCEAAHVPCYLKQMEQNGKRVVEPFLDGKRYLGLPWRTTKGEN